jgi:hypothetical protein
LAKLAGRLTPFGDWFKAAGTALNAFKLGAALVSGDGMPKIVERANLTHFSAGGAGTAGAGLGLTFTKEMLSAAVKAGNLFWTPTLFPASSKIRRNFTCITGKAAAATANPLLKVTDWVGSIKDINSVSSEQLFSSDY